MNNRRKGDRRRYDHRPSFPLVDSDGNLITKNRRRVVDRRYHQAGMEAEDGEGGNPAASVAEPVPEATGGVTLSLRLGDRLVELGDETKNFSIGRHSTSDLRIDSKAVSRKHLEINWEDGHFVVHDQSSNGTYVTEGDGEARHVLGETVTLEGEGVLYLGLPPDNPLAIGLAYTVSP